jgi:DNA-binding transcriptional LysR family regulator
VAISDLILAEESLRDGVLAQPFATTIEQGIGYYLVYPPDRAQQPKIRILREWLMESARRLGEPAPDASTGGGRQGSGLVASAP